MKQLLTAQIRFQSSSLLLRRGFSELQSVDPRPLVFFMGILLLAGGCFLFLPFARFVPPFIKLFEVMPSWAWAVYFIACGMAIALGACIPDGADCGKHHCLTWCYWLSLLAYFNWILLFATSVLTIVYLQMTLNHQVIYGIAVAFYPVLMVAAKWALRRLRELQGDVNQDAIDHEEHIQRLCDTARTNRDILQFQALRDKRQTVPQMEAHHRHSLKV